MSSKNERADIKTRDDATRNEPAASQHRGIAGDARSSEQAGEQGTQETKTKAVATPRKRRPPFVL